MPSHAAGPRRRPVRRRELVDQQTNEPTPKVQAAGWSGLLGALVLAAADQFANLQPTSWLQAVGLGALMYGSAYLKRERG